MNVNWCVAPHTSRRDPTFYRTGHNSTVAEISHNGRTLYVQCDGDTLVTLYNADHEELDVLRYADDFIAHGIKSDRRLTILTNKNLLWWNNNSWFDLYDDNGHLGCSEFPMFDIYGAVETAKTVLLDMTGSTRG